MNKGLRITTSSRIRDRCEIESERGHRRTLSSAVSSLTSHHGISFAVATLCRCHESSFLCHERSTPSNATLCSSSSTLSTGTHKFQRLSANGIWNFHFSLRFNCFFLRLQCFNTQLCPLWTGKFVCYLYWAWFYMDGHVASREPRHYL